MKKTHESANFLDQKDLILAEVAKHGDLADMSAWRSAFPDIEFIEVDETITGRRIDWEDYTPVEKAAYVAFMTNPQNAEFSFEVEYFELNSFETLSGEELWACWLSHVLAYLENGHLMSDEALETLLFYAEEVAREAEVDLRDVEVAPTSFYHEKVI